MWDLSIKKTGLLYGFNKMRFPAPLLIPADISVDVTLLSVDATDQFCRVTSTVTTWAEDTVKPVCVTEPVILYTL
jgi:acyl dehydratase